MKTSSKILLSIGLLIVCSYIHGVLFGKGGVFVLSQGDSPLGYVVLQLVFGFVAFLLPLRAIWKKRKTEEKSESAKTEEPCESNTKNKKPLNIGCITGVILAIAFILFFVFLANTTPY